MLPSEAPRRKARCGVCGDVAVWVDAGVLDDAVPDVAVDVGREGGVGEEDGETADDGDSEDEGEGEAVGGTEEDKEAGEDVTPDGPAGGAGEADGVVLVLEGKVTGEQEEESAEEGEGEVGLPGTGVEPVVGVSWWGWGSCAGVWSRGEGGGGQFADDGLKIEEELAGLGGGMAGVEGEGGGGVFEEFGGEEMEGGGIVDVVPEGKFDELQGGFAAALAGLVGDERRWTRRCRQRAGGGGA